MWAILTAGKARKYHPVREQLCSLTRVKIRMTPPEIPLEATLMVCLQRQCFWKQTKLRGEMTGFNHTTKESSDVSKTDLHS